MQKARAFYLAGRRLLWEFVSPWRTLPDIVAAIGKDEIEKKIAYAQVRKLSQQSPYTWLAALMAFVFWAAAMWPFLDEKGPLLLWLTAGLGGVIYGIAMEWSYSRQPETERDLRSWEVKGSRMAVLLGVVWGCAGLALPPDTRMFDPYFVMLLLLVTGGHIALYTHYRCGLLWFTLPLMLTAVIILLSRGDMLRIILAFGFLLAMIEILRNANHAGHMLTATLVADEEKRALTDELQIQRKEAETSNRAKTRFLTAASHDLRQPINSIALLLGALRGASQPLASQLIERMDASIQSMDRLLNAILEVATLDAGTVAVQIEPTPLMPLLEKIGQQFEPQAHAKHIQFQIVPTHCTVMTDAFQLTRIISNLVSNAIRYTRPSGRILVRCRERQEMLWIQVADNGIGISKQEQAHIFEEFYQVDHANDPNAPNESLGLGLSIVQRIAQRLQHSLALRSRPGHGSIFSVGMPLCAAPSGQAISTAMTGIAYQDWKEILFPLLNGLLILVIEDDERVMQDMTLFLKSFHCRILPASCQQEALSVVENPLRTPDLIISDYRLRGSDLGTDVIKKIRKDIAEDIPALLITAEYLPDPADYTQFDGIPTISKPVQLPVLAKTLAELLPVKTGYAPEPHLTALPV